MSKKLKTQKFKLNLYLAMKTIRTLYWNLSNTRSKGYKGGRATIALNTMNNTLSTILKGLR